MTALVDWSTNMPNFSSSPEMVPTRETCGRSGSLGFGTTIAFGTTAVVTGGAGGRRDGRKIGRSRVVENCLSGMAQSGLALKVRSGGGAAAGGGGIVICTTLAAGSVQVEGTCGFTCLLSAWSSRASSE